MVVDFATAATRLLIALVFGALIGVERQWRHKTAGIKTNTLVALGAAGFAIISNTFGESNHNPAQIAAAVVSGIGFIGAGVIIHRGGATVQGVTTAATLWANASVGVAVGLGQHAVALAVFGGIVVAQFTLRRVSNYVSRRNDRRGTRGKFEVRVECTHDTLRTVNDALGEYAESQNLTPLRRTTQRSSEGVVWKAVFLTRDEMAIDLTPLEEHLVALTGVQRVETRHLGIEEE
jgi:putative Mg2+ transporter-C (MgtC) family protein